MGGLIMKICIYWTNPWLRILVYLIGILIMCSVGTEGARFIYQGF